MNPPGSISEWLGCVAFVGGLLIVGMKIVDRIRGKTPEPPNSSLEIGRRELERRIGQAEVLLGELQAAGNHTLEQLRVERREDLRQQEISQRASAAKVYDRIEMVRKELAGAVEENRKELGQQTEVLRKEFAAAHDKTRDLLAKQFQDVERALGRIEGKINA
jgi:hypothetical protein